MIYCFESHLLGYLLKSKCTLIALNMIFLLIQDFKTLVQAEINRVLRESGVEDRHLVAGFKNNRSGGSRFERVGSVIALPNRQKPCQTSETSSTYF